MFKEKGITNDTLAYDPEETIEIPGPPNENLTPTGRIEGNRDKGKQRVTDLPSL